MRERVEYIPVRGELAQFLRLREEQMSREEQMVRTWGEVCTRKVAGKILGRDRSTVSAMLRDGRLKAACEGKSVDVRSIAAYIECPAAMDSQARYEKRAAKDEAVSRYRV